MGVQVAASLSVNESDSVTVLDKSWWSFCIEFWFITVWVEEPIVVGIFVVVTSNLLLHRSFWVCLDVRMEETTTVAHVLKCNARANCDFERRVLADLSAAEVGLEEGRHLRISWTAVFENEEVEVEGEHVHHQGDDDQANYAEDKVLEEFDLRLALEQLHFRTTGYLTFGILTSPNLFHKSSAV